MKKRSSLEMWKKLWPYARKYRAKFIYLAIIMIFVAGIDAVLPLMTRHAIDQHIITGNLEGIEVLVGGFILLVLWQTINVFGLIVLAGRIEMDLAYDLRRKGFEHLQKLAFSYFDRTATGWIMSRMTSDCERLGETISWGLVDLVWGFTVMAAVAGIMLVLDPLLALIALAVVPVLFLVSRYFQGRILKTQRLVRKNNSRISAAYNEGIMGAQTSKTLVREDENTLEFSFLTGRMRKTSVQSAVFSSLYLPVVLMLGSVGTALVLWSGGLAVGNTLLSYGSLAAFVTYTIRFFDPLRELARVLAEMQSAQASGERLLRLLDEKLEITDQEQIEAIYGTVLDQKKENWLPIKGAIEFDDVSFSYSKGEQVLDHFDLKIAAGTSLALVGETGSGKSTIINLACRFYEPTSGKILLDGQDYRNFGLPGLHSSLGYVLQSPQLFSGTVMENIRYGKLEATDQEIIEAAKLVHAHQFIEKLDQQYDTPVGEGGSFLSLGQKQLISFARAILADPRILVLDEATSSIDSETEALIQSAIHKVLHGRTSLIVAHRLSTIRDADRIILLEKGRIVEDGDHDSLMKLEGRYHRLYTNQFLEEEENRLLEAK